MKFDLDNNTLEGPLAILERLDSAIGNTKTHKLNFFPGNLFVKLEYQNIFGSIKDRAALNIIKHAVKNDLIGKETTVIESTSGNFGVSLANICRALGVNFIPVIDPNISKEKEAHLKLLCPEIIKVTERDETGGYLLNRIRTVEKYLLKNCNVFHPNQYENSCNYLAYYNSLADELCDTFSKLDYVFVSVSTGGTITGLSLRLKEKFKDINIIAVDVLGSMIFGNEPKKRTITGMGASKRSILFDSAIIDDVIILSEPEIVNGCYSLLRDHNLFLGASSGAAYYAARKTLKKLKKKDVNAIFISADSGQAYLESIYNNSWLIQNNLI
jgi:cysteine synthase A